MLLSSFLNANYTALLEQCKGSAAARNTNIDSPALDDGLAIFLRQLVDTLESVAGNGQAPNAARITAPPGGVTPFLSQMGETAAKHGHALMLSGYSINQVVHSYGDLCQAITELASKREVAISTEDFQVLNRCLDDAIADAVTEFAYRRDTDVAGKNTDALNERLGSLAHELRNLVHTATLSVEALKTGKVGVSGATVGILDRSLGGLRNLIDRSLVDVRLSAGLPPLNMLAQLADVIADAKMAASLEAESSKCELVVGNVDPGLGVKIDRHLLLGAIANLLQNAFKYSKVPKKASLNAYASSDHIFIEVADTCGGLAQGVAEHMFLPFNKLSPERRGLGLGLSICRRSVIANEGVLSVRNTPGCGCLFTIALPRYDWPVPDRMLPAIDGNVPSSVQ